MEIDKSRLGFYFFKIQVGVLNKVFSRLGLEINSYSGDVIDLNITSDKKYIADYITLKYLISQYVFICKSHSKITNPYKNILEVGKVKGLFSYKTSKWLFYFFKGNFTNCSLVDTINFFHITNSNNYLCLVKYKVNCSVYFFKNPLARTLSFFTKKISIVGRKLKKTINSPQNLYFRREFNFYSYNPFNYRFYLSIKGTELNPVQIFLKNRPSLNNVKTYFISIGESSFFKKRFGVSLNKRNFIKISFLLKYSVLRSIKGRGLFFKTPNYKKFKKSNQILTDFLTWYSITKNFSNKGLKVSSSFFYKQSNPYLSIYRKTKSSLIDNGFFEIISNGFTLSRGRRVLKHSLVPSLLDYFKYYGYTPIFELNNVFLNSKLSLKINEMSSLVLVYPYFKKTKINYTFKYREYIRGITGVYLNYLKRLFNRLLLTLSVKKDSIRWNYFSGFGWERHSAYFSVTKGCNLYLKFGKLIKGGGSVDFLNKNYSVFGIELLFKNFNNLGSNGKNLTFKKRLTSSHIHNKGYFYTLIVHKKTLVTYIQKKLLTLNLREVNLKLTDVFVTKFKKKILFSVNLSNLKRFFCNDPSVLIEKVF